MGRGTGWYRPAQVIRSASPDRSSPLPAGAHLMKQRPAPSPAAKVSPPTAFTQTRSSFLPRAADTIAAGTVAPESVTPPHSHPVPRDTGRNWLSRARQPADAVGEH